MVLQAAFVMPVMLIVCMGVCEFGQYLYIRAAFQAGARDAARAASLPGATTASIEAVATTTLAQANVTLDVNHWFWVYDIPESGGTGVTASDVSAIPSGDRVQVVIATPYSQVPNAFRPLSQIFGAGIGSGKVVGGTCTTVKE